MLCASCQRRLCRGVLSNWSIRVSLRRGVQSSSSRLEINKPKPKEEDTSVKEFDFPASELPRLPKGGVSPDEPIKLPVEASEEETDRVSQLAKLSHMYLRLSKHKLTALVVMTTLAGYGIAPGAIDPSTVVWVTAGTALCSAAANTFNQWIEIPYDALMTRTKNRVLVRKQLSPNHAAVFGLTAGLTGTSLLYLLVNPLTAALGVANVLLYTSLYTPMKRISIVNTWVGSVVGSIPPLMGWTACTGSLDPGAFVLAGILYAWQFAHFNALSWGLRGDYSRAGYQMMSVTNPDLCKRVALRYSLATIPICSIGGPLSGVTTVWFAVDSLVPNIWLSYLAWRFYQDSDFKSSRKLFYFTLFHLPLVMALLFVNKQYSPL